MKKIIINIGDMTYQKLKFQAVYEQKNVEQLITERILKCPFLPLVDEIFDQWIVKEYENGLKENECFIGDEK